MTYRSDMLRAHKRAQVFSNKLAKEAVLLLRGSRDLLRASLEVKLNGTRSMRRIKALERETRAIRRTVFTRVDHRIHGRLELYGIEEISAAAADLELPRRTRILPPNVTTMEVRGRTITSWMEGMRRADLDRIMAIVRLGLTEGKETSAIVREILGTARLRGRNGAVAVAERQLAAMARTSVIHVFSRVRGEAAAELGLDETYELAPGSHEHSNVCRDLRGKTFKAGEGPYPPQHFNCKSVRIPLEEKTR